MKMVIILIVGLMVFVTEHAVAQGRLQKIEPFVYNKTTLIPIRQFANALGFEVQTNQEKIELVSTEFNLIFEVDLKKIVVNGEDREMSFPVMKFDGVTFLPARDLALVLNEEIELVNDSVFIGDVKFDLCKGKFIRNVISTQRIYCYEDNLLIKESLLSSARKGRHNHYGPFMIGRKARGPAWDAPYKCWLSFILQFHERHLFHAWPQKYKDKIADPGNQIGHPHSNGCVRLYYDFAKWLYEWAPSGTKGETIK